MAWFTITGTNEGNLGASPPTGNASKSMKIADASCETARWWSNRGIPESLLSAAAWPPLQPRRSLEL